MALQWCKRTSRRPAGLPANRVSGMAFGRTCLQALLPLEGANNLLVHGASLLLDFTHNSLSASYPSGWKLEMHPDKLEFIWCFSLSGEGSD